MSSVGNELWPHGGRYAISVADFSLCNNFILAKSQYLFWPPFCRPQSVQYALSCVFFETAPPRILSIVLVYMRSIGKTSVLLSVFDLTSLNIFGSQLFFWSNLVGLGHARLMGIESPALVLSPRMSWKAGRPRSKGYRIALNRWSTLRVAWLSKAISAPCRFRNVRRWIHSLYKDFS
jgi:hypothetical protein